MVSTDSQGLETCSSRKVAVDGPSPFLDGHVNLYRGDCRSVVAALPSNSVDAVVTDPPYAIASILARFGAAGAAPAKHGTDGAFARQSRDFLGRSWDTGDVAFDAAFWRDVCRVVKPGGYVFAFSGRHKYHRLACAIEDGGFDCRDAFAWTYGTGQPHIHSVDKMLTKSGDADHADEWAGWKTGVKPAFEPIFCGRKAFSGTVAENCLTHGTGALNIDACRVGERFPANLLHDGSPDVLAAFPAGDGPSPARFFYCAKASDDDRLGFTHPTIKPISLMRWLVRLAVRRGGVVLDPFAGTGTTGAAAWREGSRAILIEREPDYQAMIARRMELTAMGPEEHQRALTAPAPADALPLFGAA